MVNSSTTTSISPVGRFAFACPVSRGATRPPTEITSSCRSECARSVISACSSGRRRPGSGLRGRADQQKSPRPDHGVNAPIRRGTPVRRYWRRAERCNGECDTWRRAVSLGDGENLASRLLLSWEQRLDVRYDVGVWYQLFLTRGQHLYFHGWPFVPVKQGSLGA